MNDQMVKAYLKGLVIDGVHTANSGHPGGALSSMDFAYKLFRDYLNFHPEDPNWEGRDRFILSAGHESMLQYALLYAMGWLEEKDLRAFRQLDSRTPGHPEVGITPGVECTTGPLGQGAAMSVGFAIAASHRHAKMAGKLPHNRTWALLGDGCMQEGVTYAAASLAGHLGLDHLIWYYDRNAQQISGHIDKAYSDDPAMVFTGMGWQVTRIDAHNNQEMQTALEQCMTPQGKPILIIGDSIMAKGCFSMEGSHKTHGSPLPQDERTATKKALGIPADAEFYFPENAKQHFRQRYTQLRQQAQEWGQALHAACQASPTEAQNWKNFTTDIKSIVPPAIPWEQGSKVATRNAFGTILEQWADLFPTLIGGSADLEPSNMTGAFAAHVGDFTQNSPSHRNIHFGVREFPMAAIANGIALYGGMVPFTATFLSFADYSRPAIRLGALQKCRVIHELTHDSFYLGEDGPTHQPIEHVMSLRSMPDVYVMRPADALETEVMFRQALTLETPSAMCLTRQKLPSFAPRERVSDIQRGAWSVTQCHNPQLILFATGSEVALAMAVHQALGRDDIEVVSIPCWEIFWQQEQSYIDHILKPECTKRISIEAGSTLGWEKFVGANGMMIGIDHYGESAPAAQLAERFGFTTEAILAKIHRHLL
ncbi:MAG: transketolase [Zetaproteobacteria bacterium]|nr:transketolase [Zetaproteobacteria bacterium]